MNVSWIRLVLLALLLGASGLATTVGVAMPIAQKGTLPDQVTVTIDGRTFLAGVGDVIGEGELVESGLCDLPAYQVSVRGTGPGSASVSIGTDAECRLFVRSIESSDSLHPPSDPEGGESRSAEPSSTTPSPP